MAWYPHAIRKNIPPGANDPRIIPVGSILHVAVSGADSLFPYFDGPSGGIESTWYIRYDGTVEQYRDSDYEADANGQGNSWIGSDGRRYGLHSVETAGFEHGEWTDAQIESIKKLLVWDAREHGWPLQVIPRWNGSGVGYHVMFGAPGPYTNVRGKTCPGPDRVRQFHDIITPWLRAGADLEDDMTPEQAKKLDEIYYLLNSGSDQKVIRPDDPDKTSGIRWALQRVWGDTHRLLPRILSNQQAIMAAQGVEVDEAELGQQIAAVLVPAVVAELSEATDAETEAVMERVLRRVLGSLDDA